MCLDAHKDSHITRDSKEIDINILVRVYISMWGRSVLAGILAKFCIAKTILVLFFLQTLKRFNRKLYFCVISRFLQIKLSLL